MAEALEKEWGASEGYVITRYGYGRPCVGIEIIEAAHPVPDDAGAHATAELLRRVSGLKEEDVVVSLISGGGSALLVHPAGDITLGEKQAINAALLASGAPIDKMNTVRKHLSRVKGGQLAAAIYPARHLSLMISDIPGDDPSFIASGPTVGDETKPSDALAILEAYGIEIPSSVMSVLSAESGVVAPEDTRLSRTETRIIAAPSQSLEAAAEVAREAGVTVEILGDALEGEARDLAAEHASLALERQAAQGAGDRPLVLLSGGECTVTRTGQGRGGPNAEYVLALAHALEGAPGITAIACDTDGVDGADEVAGALCDPGTPDRANAAGRDMAAALSDNDAHGFFASLGDQVITGPTLTNVNDFRAILIAPKEG
jgi:hydroxypyruvate reductase